MADLSVVAVITAKPGSEDAVRAALIDLVAPTRNEEGCRSYDLYESASVASTFVTIETWREQSDLDAHMQTPNSDLSTGHVFLGSHRDHPSSVPFTLHRAA